VAIMPQVDGYGQLTSRSYAEVKNLSCKGGAGSFSATVDNNKANR
jgi:hypothetical protein